MKRKHSLIRTVYKSVCIMLRLFATLVDDITILPPNPSVLSTNNGLLSTTAFMFYPKKIVKTFGPLSAGL